MTVRRGTPTPITTPIIILLVWVKPELAVTFVMFAVLVELVELGFVVFVVFVEVGVVVVVELVEVGFVVFEVVVFFNWRMRSIKSN